MITDPARRLPAGMTDLHPEFRPIGGACPGIGTQLIHATIAVDDDVAGALEITAIHLHIACYDDGRTAFGPSSVETDMAGRRAIHLIGEPLGQRRFADAILEDDAIRQLQWLGKE